MPVRQDVRSGVGNFGALVLRIFKLCWNVAKSLPQLLGRLVTNIFSAVKTLYASRAKIVGFLLLTSFVSLLLIGVNHFIGFDHTSSTVNHWFLSKHHWVLVVGGLLAVVLLAWNYVAPSLRTLFNNSWFRLGSWAVVGGVVLTYARYGWSDGAISYRDGYLGLLILGIALLGILSEAFPPRVSPRKDSPYVIDNPKGSSTTSELFESQKQIVKDIEYLFNNGKPSVFAVTGEWGVGKTYLLWRAISEVESNHTDIIWAEFQPWRYASEEALIRGFYHDIGDALAKEIPGIQRITSPLLETTDKFVRKHDGTGIVGTIVDLFRDITEPEKGPEEQIPEVLERECRRLVVVIDDVERSYKTEHIFRTLQLALIAKNIENVQVVFLYEKERIIKAGPDHLADSSGTGSTYLEKFIEREVFVPTPRPSELRQLFLAYMGAYQGSLGLNFDEEDLPDYMLNAIATPRSVIRLFNEFAAFRINTEGEN